MPLPLLSGGVRAVVEGRIDGQTTNNVLYFQKPSGDPSFIEVSNLGTLLDDWYATTMLPLLNENFTYLRVRLQAINVGEGFQAENSNSVGPGAVSGEAAPNNVAPCVSFRTGTGGRSNRGRNYVPGISNSDVSGNEVSPAWQAGVTSAYAQLIAGGTFDPTIFRWVVASFFTGGVPRGSAVATEITSVIFSDNIVDSQRRRLPGRGR